ncbi:flagellar hook-associated protein 3 FlgL [Cytobacillus eiseniae]|uniref:Flagellar hook-associated protein 3 FlgL n=1 Tax=Cytobacillus eiseniae TaxID=762947 RepID=A0ABS4RI45_9BACI|nr:flagellar hook-associated protein FlgL [Cytobacillus eiseniae]MBP2241979.1 flagellar hook-associated protein 3 FlgL [Cytobacillus eiseniae]
MRVTQSMLSNNMLRNLSNNYNKLGKLQEQMNTQKKFTKPSDNPVAAMQGLGYRTDLERIQQFQRNIGEVQKWVDSTDSALDNAISALQRIRELTVKASNGTLEADQREAVTKEIQQLKEQIETIGDTEVGGQYIFNGVDTNKRPSDGYSDGEIKLEVFSGIKLPINTVGKDLFGPLVGGIDTATGQPIDSYLDKLINTINTGTEADISGELKNIDDHIDKFISERATVGARQNRVEMMDERLGQQEVFSTRILSNNEDLDMEKAIIEMTTAESVLRASLSVGSRIIQPTLVDFLR